MVGPGDSRTADVVVAVVLLTTLSTLSFVGRIWGRLLSAVRLGWDDLFMTIALVSDFHYVFEWLSTREPSGSRSVQSDMRIVGLLGNIGRQYYWYGFFD